MLRMAAGNGSGLDSILSLAIPGKRETCEIV
jgi:hypothetical protein